MFTTLYTYVPLFLTVYDVTFNYGFLDISLKYLYAFKIQQYFKNRSARTILTVQDLIDFSRHVISTKMLQLRIENAEMTASVDLFSNSQIPVWLANILSCVPILPRVRTTTFQLFGVPFTLDASNTFGAGPSSDGLITNTQAQILKSAQVLAFLKDVNIYTGPLTKCSLSGSDYAIFKYILKFTASFPFGPSENILQPDSSGSMKLSPDGFSNNVVISLQHEVNTTLTPQIIVALIILQPTLINFSPTTYWSTLMIPTRILSTGPSDPNWGTFLNSVFTEFPNPAEVSAEQTPPSEIQESKPKNGQNAKQVDGDSTKQKNKISISLTKIRRSEISKISDLGIKLEVSGSKKLSPAELNKMRDTIKNICLNVEKTANIAQIDSSYLFEILAKNFKTARNSVNPDVGSQDSA